MKTFALIGRSIQHSKSPDMYRKLLDEEVDYTLLDYPSEEAIEPLAELAQRYKRVSITAPYKNAVYRGCDSVDEAASSLSAVNAIKLSNGRVLGTNTDILAFKDIFLERYKSVCDRAIILGDGAMSRLAVEVFKQNNFPCQVLSRRLGNLERLTQILESLGAGSEKALLINACSRSYNFDFSSPKSLKIWDMNYAMPEHESFAKEGFHEYHDGSDLLFRQAQYALSFWNL